MPCLRRKSSGVETASYLLCLLFFFPQRLVSTTGVVIRQWLSTLTHQPQGHRRPAGGVFSLLSACHCIVTAREEMSLPCFPQTRTFLPCRNEDILKTKRISFFTTRGRQRSGTEAGVCVAGGWPLPFLPIKLSQFHFQNISKSFVHLYCHWEVQSTFIFKLNFYNSL